MADIIKPLQVEPAAITVVAGAAASIKVIDVPGGMDVLHLQIKNTHASVAFDTLTIQNRATVNGTWVSNGTDAASYTTAVKYPMLGASASPVTLAAAATVSVFYDVRGIDAINILASGNAATSEATLYYSFSQRR